MRIRHESTRWSALVAAILLSTPVGCGGDRADSSATDAASRIAAEDASQRSPEPAAYRWPAGPDHPVLIVDVEGPQGGGTIEIELMPELAPETVPHVIGLARSGFYDGTTFHRVIPGFMIQGGDPNSRDRDPTNDGKGGPDVSLEDEFSDAPFLRGVVAMANTGREDSAGSQFFIMQADHRDLDGRYTVIGRVCSGMEVVDSITRVTRDEVGRWGPRDRPIEDVVMTRVRVADAAGA
jgi:peptidyl-prolyl cis-trans isomerase B (cyclophilin B)